MKYKLLALAGLVAFLSGCANPPPAAEPAAFSGEGAEVAASLGFHGPVERAPERLYSRN